MRLVGRLNCECFCAVCMHVNMYVCMYICMYAYWGICIRAWLLTATSSGVPNRFREMLGKIVLLLRKKFLAWSGHCICMYVCMYVCMRLVGRINCECFCEMGMYCMYVCMYESQ